MAGEDNFSLLNPGFTGKYTPDGLNPNRKPQKPRSAPAAQAAPAAQVDPFAQFLDMFSSFGGGRGPHPAQTAPHQPSGPTEAEIAQTTGENDLQSLYDTYSIAASDATTFINQKIDNDRSQASLIGVNYSITDEQKQSDINDYFSTIFSNSDYEKLQKLNTDFGGDLETPYEFLVTPGNGYVAPGTEDTTDTGAAPSGGGGTLTTDDEETLGTTSLLGG